MGPVEVIVITLPNLGRIGALGPALESLVRDGGIRIADAVLVTLDESGQMRVTDLEDDVVPAWTAISPSPLPLLSAEDAALVAEELEGESAAILLAVEHVWPESLADVVSSHGGSIQLHARIDPEVVAAATRASD